MLSDALPRSANLRRDETADRASLIDLETVSVVLDLTSASDLDIDTFATEATLTFSARTTSTWIDFLGASVDEVVVNGRPEPVRWDGARINVEGLGEHNVVRIRAHGRFSSSGEGLHRFRDPVDDEVYLYTQYEPADARRVYPCFEQPDLKARWRFDVAAPAGWVVLSNGPEISRVQTPGGVRVSFAETLPLSSYITAVAAGPYHRIDGEWREGERQVDLGVLCRASLATHLDAEEILDVTRRGLSFYEESFGYAYPWGKYDQIFVPEYNLGAMENPGLVTFTEAYIFRGASTAAQHEARANTILHEMAHMWFGDLVTMRWWDDLWLKESFADFMGTYVAARAGGYPEAWVSFASRRKGWAYEQDQLPTTHPIVADIVDLEAAKLNFDGITYAKGASVLKQLVAFVGEDAFFEGVRRYFAEHAFSNTTLEDLLRALESASGRELRSWSDRWLRTTGMSELSAERGTPLTLVQTDARPHRVEVGLYDTDAGRLVRRAGVSLDIVTERTTVDAPVLPDVALIVPNDDDSTYGKVRLDDRSITAVEASLSTIEDPLARSVIWASLWNATRDGELPVARYVGIVSRHAPLEPSVALLADALGHVTQALDRFAAEADRPALVSGWLATVWDSLWSAEPASDRQLAWARGLAPAASVCDERAEQIRSLLRGESALPTGLALDPELRWSWLRSITTTGHASDADAAAELATDPTASGHTAHRSALAARPDSRVRAAAWLAAWDDRSLSNDHLDATIEGIRAGSRRDLIAHLEEDYFARIRGAWHDRSIELARRLVRGLFPASDNLDLVDSWLTANDDAPAALRRIVIEQRDALARSLRVRSLQSTLSA